MRASYVMIDPAGRFFDNGKGIHTYSGPLIKIGVKDALKEISFDNMLFLKRGGIYRWK